VLADQKAQVKKLKRQKAQVKKLKLTRRAISFSLKVHYERRIRSSGAPSSSRSHAAPAGVCLAIR